MVPAIVKESRCKRVDETIMTAYGLVIIDGFAHAVAAKKMAKTKKMLRAMVEFRQWANSDAPRLCMFEASFLCGVLALHMHQRIYVHLRIYMYIGNEVCIVSSTDVGTALVSQQTSSDNVCRGERGSATAG